MEKEEIKVGDRVVVFNYTNTVPIANGIVVAISKDFIEVLENPGKWFAQEVSWHPRSDCQKVTN